MDDLFFYLSKLIWLVISPDILFVLLMLLAMILLYAGKLTQARRLLTFLTIVLLLVAILPIGQWMTYPLESRFRTNPPLPQKVDGIIVLGGAVLTLHSEEWGQLETNQARERIEAGIDLARQYPEARLVFSGGNASLIADRPTEAEMVRQRFIDAGIQPRRVVLENKARNTAENASFIKHRIKPENDQNWLLVTSAYHMPRSIGLFCKLDWPVLPYPVDHATLPSRLWQPTFNIRDHVPLLTQATHEWLGLLAYYLSGRIDSIFPSKC